MKRLLSVLIALSICFFSIFGWDINDYNLRNWSQDGNYKDLEYKLFESSAALEDSHFNISLPSVKCEISHLSSLLMNYSGMGTGDLLSMAYGFLSDYTGGKSNLLNLNVFTGSQIGKFAFGASVSGNIATDIDEYESLVDPEMTVIPSADATLLMGYGTTLIEKNGYSFDAGISLGVKAKVIIQEIGVDDVLKLMDEEITTETLLSELSADAGFAFTNNFSFAFNMFNRHLKLECNISDVLGTFYMKSYSEIEKVFQQKYQNKSYTIENPSTVKVSLMVNPFRNNRYVDGNIRIGFSTEPLSVVEDWKSGLEFKCELRLFKFIEYLFSFKSGYCQVGLSLDCYGNKIEMIYGWHEEGQHLGEKPVDSLSLKCTLGYEK